jgi:CRISPR-associated protein (TIGR02584 family)
MHEPEDYPRRILLTAAGLTPQVVTETLYALAVGRNPAFVPTEVHVFTTQEGAQRVRLQLLSEDPGWFHRLRGEYKLSAIDFSMANVHVVEGESGVLEDIHTPGENAAVADAAALLMAEFCRDEDAAVHVSIAGGRKTMGYYLGYALSLYGRPQDRLSHVLIEPPFESHPEFFFPTRKKHVIYTHPPEQRPLDTSEARVMLAEIPFVRLRDGLPDALLERRASFTETVELAQESLGPANLRLDISRGLIVCNGRNVHMPSVYFSFYLTVTRYWLAGKAPGRHELRTADFLNVYQQLVGEMDGNYERVEASLRGEDMLPVTRFDEYRSKANQFLSTALGPLARLFLIEGKRGKQRFNRYGLWGLSREAVRFARLGEAAQDEPLSQPSGEGLP